VGTDRKSVVKFCSVISFSSSNKTWGKAFAVILKKKKTYEKTCRSWHICVPLIRWDDWILTLLKRDESGMGSRPEAVDGSEEPTVLWLTRKADAIDGRRSCNRMTAAVFLATRDGASGSNAVPGPVSTPGYGPPVLAHSKFRRHIPAQDNDIGLPQSSNSSSTDEKSRNWNSPWQQPARQWQQPQLHAIEPTVIARKRLHPPAGSAGGTRKPPATATPTYGVQARVTDSNWLIIQLLDPPLDIRGLWGYMGKQSGNRQRVSHQWRSLARSHRRQLRFCVPVSTDSMEWEYSAQKTTL
jgi:hypothetical protein